MQEQQNELGFDTLALHAGHSGDPGSGSRAVPIFQTTSFMFEDAGHAARLFGLEEFGNIYTRIMNPTTDVLEKRIAALEGGSGALAVASGQAATTLAITTICEAGDEIVASSSLYGGTHSLLSHSLSRFGITTKFVDGSRPETFDDAINEKTKLIFGETIGNPDLNIFPVEKVSKIANRHGLPLIVDNTSATPYLSRPLAQGANVVVHSATKFLGGHGTSIGGLIVDGGNFNWGSGKFPGFVEPDASYHGLEYWKTFGDFPGLGNVAFILKARLQGLRDQGACMSPFNAFLILLGIETLGLRMERHSANAMIVARHLAQHPKIEWVNYPGLGNGQNDADFEGTLYRKLYGGLVGFGIKGGYDCAVKFIDKLKLFSLLANIGDAKSLVIHPASTTHQQLSSQEQLAAGVRPDFIRLSVGLESIDDILADLNQALADL